MRSRATFIASLLLAAACSREESPTAPTSGFTPSYRPGAERAAVVKPGVAFSDMAKAAGVDFEHVNGAAGRKWLPETMGSGVGMLDYDSDGDLDLLFVQSGTWKEEPQPTMRLYRNEGGWKFTDATEAAGLAIPGRYGMGLSIADYDADGDPDVYLTALGPNLLLRNDGGVFRRVDGAPDGGEWVAEKEAGVAHGDGAQERVPSWSTGAAWFDADGDGDLDLVVLSYVRWTRARDVFSSYVAGEKAYTRPELYEGDAPRLYLQQEDGSFRDATKGSGLDAARVPGKSLALCLDDFDRDGRTDIFVANDTVQNFLFLNRGGRGRAKFEESAIAAAIAYDESGNARAAMGVASGDYRNDGTISIAIGNFSEEPVSLFSVVPGRGKQVLFQDDAKRARIGTATLIPLTFGLLMTDLDLDGWCDLLLANGHIEPSISRLKAELHYEQTPQYFRNLKGERLVDVSADCGAAFSRRIVGRGLAAGDLDGDGDLDLVITSNGGRPLLLRCDLETGNRSLRLRLHQPGTRNLDALGAEVRVTAGGLTQRRVARTGGSYLSQGDPALTFGLGALAQAEKVEVRWPDGTVQEFGPLDVGEHRIVRRD